MDYVDSILEPGERVAFRGTVSWTVYAPALAILLVAAALVAFGFVPGAALIVVAAIVAAPGWFRRWTTEIAVTDRRVILKRGFIRRHTVEMNMQKVESVDVDQTTLGRIFDYGSVTIRGVGSTFERLTMIDAPLKLRSTITAG